MKRTLTTICLHLITIASFAMPCDTSKVNPNILFDKVQLRQSFQEATEEENPAKLLLSFPSTGRANWLIDAGIAARIVPLSGTHGFSKVVAEFHRNTLINKEQYNWQVGYNYSYVNSTQPGRTMLSWTGNLKYVRDVIDAGHSIATTLNLGLYKAGLGTFNIGRPAYSKDFKRTYQVDISLGTQYQQYLGGDGVSGALVRPLINTGASLAWNKARKVYTAPEKGLELTVKYVNRYAVINKTTNGEGYSKLLRTGANYYVLNNESTSVSLGISYNLGSDPFAGLRPQDFWQLAFQIQL